MILSRIYGSSFKLALGKTFFFFLIHTIYLKMKSKLNITLTITHQAELRYTFE